MQALYLAGSLNLQGIPWEDFRGGWEANTMSVAPSVVSG